jgi:hypothetical protein
MTLTIMTFSLAVSSAIMLSVDIFYWYAECHYADYRMLGVVILSVVMLSVAAPFCKQTLQI